MRQEDKFGWGVLLGGGVLAVLAVCYVVWMIGQADDARRDARQDEVATVEIEPAVFVDAGGPGRRW